MAQNETWLNHDMMNAVKVQYLDGNVFSQDNAGNLIGVLLTKGGVDYSGGGTVAANVIRADGVTVAVAGALSGNAATVVLPQTAYDVPGVLSIIVKLTVNSEVTTIAAVVANVYQSTTDSIVDPGTIIPSISALIAEIEAAVATIPADYSALWTYLAPAFDSTKTYYNGDYCTYNQRVYRFFKTHTGSWNSNDVFVVRVGEELTGTNNAYRSVIGGNPITVTRTLASTDGTVELKELKLFAGVKYRIYCDQSYGVNFYAAGNSSSYIQLSQGMNLYTAPCDGYARIYNGSAHYSGTFTIVVWQGNMLVSGYQTTVNTNAALEALTGGSRSCNDFPANSIVCIGSTDVSVSDAPNRNYEYGNTGTYITFSHTGTVRSGSAQIFIGARGQLCFRENFGASNTWNDWADTFRSNKSYITREAWLEDYPSDKLSFLPQMTSVCIASSSVAPSDAPYTNFTGTVLTIGYRAREYYAEPGDYQIALGLNDSIWYRRYVFNSGGNYWTAWHNMNGEAVYHVGTGYSYTSFTSLLYDLKDDKSHKVIYLHEGTYDIFDEYLDLVAEGKVNVPPDDSQTGDYLQYSVFVPNNTRVIGLGDVKLTMTPEAADVTIGESNMWSPLNISGNVTLENLTVIGHNCRYSMHNDDHGAVQNAHQHYKNCRFIYTLGDMKNGVRLGYSNTIGFGLGEGCTHTFDDCEIYYIGDSGRSAYYGHESNSGLNGSLILRNCIIWTQNFSSNYTVRLQTLGTNAGHVKAYFENCYINGHLMLDLTNSASRNNFEVTFVNCNKVPVIRQRSDTSVPIVDPYTIRWFNPLPTPTAENPLIDTDSI